MPPSVRTPPTPVRAARPDRRVQRVQVLGRRRRVVGGQHVPMTWPSRVGDTAHSLLLSGGATPRTPRCPRGRAPMAKTAIVSGPPRGREAIVYSCLVAVFVRSKAVWRGDFEQPESGGEAGPRRHGQGQSVTSWCCGASWVARGTQDVNGDAGQILQVAGELVGPATARGGGDPFREPRQRVKQCQLALPGGRPPVRPRCREAPAGRPASVAGPPRADCVRCRGGDCPAHPGRGAGVRVPDSIGGIARDMPRYYLPGRPAAACPGWPWPG